MEVKGHIILGSGDPIISSDCLVKTFLDVITEGPDAGLPPLTTVHQLEWRLKASDGSGIYTDGTRCWFGFPGTVIRYVDRVLYSTLNQAMELAKVKAAKHGE